MTPDRCEVCRREGASQDYSADGRPRGVLCLNCGLAVRRIEADVVRIRRVLGYIKKYAPRPARPS